MKDNYIVQGWLVVVLCLAFGGILAGVDIAWRGRIEANQLAETLGQVPALVPAATEGQADTVSGQTVYRAITGDRLLGWVIPCSGQGFADRISLLVGVDGSASVITGLYVLDQKETPGLGNRIVGRTWRDQFVGKSTATPLVASRNRAATSHEIDAVTGATISSVAVCTIVNETVGRFAPALAARGAVGGAR